MTVVLRTGAAVCSAVLAGLTVLLLFACGPAAASGQASICCLKFDPPYPVVGQTVTLHFTVFTSWYDPDKKYDRGDDVIHVSFAGVPAGVRTSMVLHKPDDAGHDFAFTFKIPLNAKPGSYPFVLTATGNHGAADLGGSGYHTCAELGDCPPLKVGLVVSMFRREGSAEKNISYARRTVSLGEAVDLRVSPVIPGTSTWTVDGKTVGDYVVTAATARLTPTRLRGTATLFHWIEIGKHRVTYTLRKADGTTASVFATFDVRGPEPQRPAVTMNPVRIYSRARDGLITVGPGDGFGHPGFRMAAPSAAGLPPGHFLFAQIITGGGLVSRNARGGVRRCDLRTGLDNAFPYRFATDARAVDFPNKILEVDKVAMDVREQFRMYLMWQAAEDGAIPVALGASRWYWRAVADRAGTSAAWTLTKGVVGHGETSGDRNPEWTAVVGNATSAWACAGGPS